MSGIYIPGMEMPKRGHTVTITIVGSGETYVEYYDCKPHVEETIEYKAVPAPEHGRLIDADALKMDLTRFYDGEVVAKRLIDEQPTIIPADPPVMEYPQIPGITPTVIAEEGEG